MPSCLLLANAFSASPGIRAEGFVCVLDAMLLAVALNVCHSSIPSFPLCQIARPLPQARFGCRWTIIANCRRPARTRSATELPSRRVPQGVGLCISASRRASCLREIDSMLSMQPARPGVPCAHGGQGFDGISLGLVALKAPRPRSIRSLRPFNRTCWSASRSAAPCNSRCLATSSSVGWPEKRERVRDLMRCELARSRTPSPVSGSPPG
jgi:hypothetical protein